MRIKDRNIAWICRITMFGVNFDSPTGTESEADWTSKRIYLETMYTGQVINLMDEPNEDINGICKGNY